MIHPLEKKKKLLLYLVGNSVTHTYDVLVFLHNLYALKSEYCCTVIRHCCLELISPRIPGLQTLLRTYDVIETVKLHASHPPSLP